MILNHDVGMDGVRRLYPSLRHARFFGLLPPGSRSMDTGVRYDTERRTRPQQLLDQLAVVLMRPPLNFLLPRLGGLGDR